MARNKYPEETVQKILAVSYRLFLEKGYEAASIQDIAAAAGYSVGSVYRQWKSKQQLFMEIWDEYVSGFIRYFCAGSPGL